MRGHRQDRHHDQRRRAEDGRDDGGRPPVTRHDDDGHRRGAADHVGDHQARVGMDDEADDCQHEHADPEDQRSRFPFHGSPLWPMDLHAQGQHAMV